MDILEGFSLNLIYLLFPLALYLIYQIYIKNLDLKEKGWLLEVALLSSLYFTIKYGVKIGTIFPMVLFNIPLLISYFKNRKFAQVVISIILIVYYNYALNINIWFLIAEYLVYFIIYNYYKSLRKSCDFLITSFIGIKSLFMSLEMFLFIRPEYTYISNLIEIFLIMSIYSASTCLIFYVLLKGESSINLNNTFRELQKEKTLRNALFKMTHEIKNPIAVCKGYLDMLDCNDTEKTKKYIPIIKNEIERTITLMDDFLDCTKVQINRNEIDLYLLLEDTIASVKPLLKKHKIKTNINIPDDEVYMMADYNRLKQVLVNIFKNSVEAQDKNRKMILEIEAFCKDNIAYIKIKDNGIGIDNEDLNRIGEMFYTTKRKGSGLGVSLSREIIQLHGGNMMYSSKKDKGTTVTITLPTTA